MVRLTGDSKEAATLQNLYVEILYPVTVKNVEVDKVFYRPGAGANAKITLTNTTNAPREESVRLVELTEFNDERPLVTKTVTVPAGGEAVLEMPFQVGPTEYGHELRAEVLRDGKVMGTNSEVFGVADNLWKIGLGASGKGAIQNSADYKKEQIASQMAGLRRTYCNWFEKSFWAPDDWGQLTMPEGASWYSGQARRHESTENLKFMIEVAQRYGIQAVSYGKSMAAGLPAWEMARRQPQWFVTDKMGRTRGRPADVWDFEHWQQADKYQYSDFKYNWTYRWPDLSRVDTLDHGIDQIIASTKEFGWDGIRFDSSGFRASYAGGLGYSGNDAVNTRNARRMKEKVWQVYPNFLFGINTNNPAAKDGREYPVSPDDPMAHEIREHLAGGGLWMGEAMRENTLRNGSVKYFTWTKFAQDEVRAIRTIKSYGGNFYYSYNVGRGAHDQYKYTIGTMMGAHQYTGDHLKADGSENWGRFLTRWSGLFWDHRLKGIDDADQLIAVESKTPLWWREYANQRVISATRRQVIVNLLNPPANDKIKEIKDMPAPVEAATVKLLVPANEKLARAFFVSPGFPNRAQELPVRREGNAALVDVPGFDVWAMVVWDLDGNYSVAKPAPLYTEPLNAEEQAELQRLAPQPNVPIVADPLNPPAAVEDPEIKWPKFGEAKVQMPANYVVGGAPGPDVLVMQGFYHEHYRVPEAIRAVAPDARIKEVTQRDFPKTHEELAAYDTIVLVDLSASVWKADFHKMLADWTQAGGNLVVLGGPFTLGQGYFKETALEAVLPVTVRQTKDVFQSAKPLALGKANNRALPGSPLLYYFHAVTPRGDATARLWAGPLPVFWQHSAGKGTARVFAGTVMGEAEKGQTPFWQDDNWPALLGTLMLR